MLAWAVPALAASTNNVYIDQVGSGSNIAVTQQGIGNEVGNGTTATVLHGNGQTIGITQVGSQNTTSVNVQGINATVNSTATGDSNAITVNCGTGGTTACTDSALTANATGNGNTLNLTAGAKTTGSITAGSAQKLECTTSCSCAKRVVA